MTEVIHPYKLDEFDDTEVESYLENPTKCPYCRSVHICRVGSDYQEFDVVIHVIKCSDCGHKWAEVYNLVSIEPYGQDPCDEQPF